MRAIEADMVSCPVCHATVRIGNDPGVGMPHCPRCKETLAFRDYGSMQTVWALVVASILFYIPANLLPMMHVHTFAGTQSDTILSGVLYFLETGSYLIAAVIFIASIVVPIAKILILIYLLLSVRRGHIADPKKKQKLYVLTELVGKWSMVDVYVVSIMIALVHFGGLTQIEAAPGVSFFLLVVIMTMVAAMKFDARFVWDNT